MTCLAFIFDTMSGVIKLQHFMPAITNTTSACNPSVDKLLSNNNMSIFCLGPVVHHHNSAQSIAHGDMIAICKQSVKRWNMHE